MRQPVAMEDDDKENSEKSKLRQLSNAHVCVSELYTSGEWSIVDHILFDESSEALRKLVA